METAALILAVLVLGAITAEAALRAQERYRHHVEELERLMDRDAHGSQE